ncbi:hypothetical protein QE109_13955 [Fusibacter bizertensis]|uniref:Uncharacterized protein n=1 Tax=Fusibacter bizertensis TaxID=1488331 RepID=A0ABT6NFV5_9FIRM|nr:hypothetical protein [Fusibacter bizertensis]MDH8679257.1 hypothetical protein [Fusibacter bizertensis]
MEISVLPKNSQATEREVRSLKHMKRQGLRILALFVLTIYQ